MLALERLFWIQSNVIVPSFHHVHNPDFELHKQNNATTEKLKLHRGSKVDVLFQEEIIFKVFVREINALYDGPYLKWYNVSLEHVC